MKVFRPMCVRNKTEVQRKVSQIHSEQNALYKMLREGVSAKGVTIYLTQPLYNVL